MSPVKALILVVLVSVVGMSTVTVAEQLREVARAYASEKPGQTLEMTAPAGDYWPKTVAELSREAVLVLQARLSRVESYLAPSEDRILTDYSITEPRLIAGRVRDAASPTPGTVVPLLLTVLGGEAIVEGVLVRLL